MCVTSSLISARLEGWRVTVGGEGRGCCHASHPTPFIVFFLLLQSPFTPSALTSQVLDIVMAIDEQTGVPKGYAFIQFRKMVDADTAITSLHNQVVACHVVRVWGGGVSIRPHAFVLFIANLLCFETIMVDHPLPPFSSFSLPYRCAMPVLPTLITSRAVWRKTSVAETRESVTLARFHSWLVSQVSWFEAILITIKKKKKKKKKKSWQWHDTPPVIIILDGVWRFPD